MRSRYDKLVSAANLAKNEEQTKACVLMPIIAEWGYDTIDIEQTDYEIHPNEDRTDLFVDIALKPKNYELPKIIIEAKKFKKTLSKRDKKQILEYLKNSKKAYKIGILTNGLIMEFYCLDYNSGLDPILTVNLFDDCEASDDNDYGLAPISELKNAMLADILGFESFDHKLVLKRLNKFKEKYNKIK